jgi:ABC-type multidrug transport system fused ATPase/permease subunit
MKEQIINTFSILDYKQKKKFFIITILICIGSFLEFLSLFVIYQTIKFFSSSKSFLAEESYFNNILNTFFDNNYSIINFSLILISIYMIKFFFFSYMYYQQFKYSAHITYELSSKLLRKYIKNNFKFHTENDTSKLMRNVKDEVSQFGVGGIQQLLILMNEIVVFLAILILLGIQEAKLLIMAFSFFVIIGVIYYLIVKRIFNKYGEKRQLYASDIMKYSLETLYGIKDLKLFNVENFFLKRFNINAKKLADAQKIITTLNQIPRIGLELLAVFLISIILIYIFNPSNFNTNILPTAGLFIIASFKLIPSISKILNSLNILRYTYPSTKVLKKEMSNSQNLDEENDSVDLNYQFKDNINFQGVYFDFKNRNKILLKNLNLKIKKNTSIGLMGISGSGKSTLIDLLAGLHNPTDGHIFIDDIDLKKIKKNWRNKICLVPQKIFLTSDTIKNNIAFGLEEDEIKENKVKEVIQQSQLDDFINKLPNGINTKIGDRGIEISGGEQQRIGIARALYRNSEVIILDEFTNSLDKKNEENLMDLIKSFNGKKTLIIIAHKKELINFCDKKYFLSAGELKQIDE